MRARIIVGLLATTLGPQAVSAEMLNVPTEFRGVRIEGDIGGDRFSALGTHRRKLGYGATIGMDGVIANRFVIGAEGSYWRANHWSENCVPAVYTGTVCTKSFQEYGTAIRAGYLVMPRLLAFAKGGWVRNEQRTRFDPTSTLLYINGQIVGPQKPYYVHDRPNGYQLGAGVEYDVMQHVYVNAQYVYSNYEDHTLRERAYIGIGARF